MTNPKENNGILLDRIPTKKINLEFELRGNLYYFKILFNK